MQTIGLIGGMSWESSQEYYRLLNGEVKARLGGLHSARIAMISLDFAPIERAAHAGDWDHIAATLTDAARQLERAGADFFLLGANTAHKVADTVQAAVGIPLLHIVDPTGEAIVQRGLRRVALLGTRFTMEETFYRDRLRERFDLDVIIPDAPARERIHRVIFDELCRGEIRAESKAAYGAILTDMDRQGAEGIILGCTEIPLLIKPGDTHLPLFDTTELHARAAVDRALAETTP